jgi:uncharacterized protein YegL
MGSEVQGGFNLFLEEQTKQNPKLKLTVVRFDDKIEVLYDGIPITEIPKATSRTFQPRGMTALYDAVFHAIRLVQRNIKKASNPSKKVMIAILTDGQNNILNDCKSLKQFKTKLQYYQNEHNWNFVYLAANQDALETGSQMGFKQQSCMTFSANPETCHQAFKGLSNSTQRYYSNSSNSASLGFTQQERHASIQKTSSTSSVAPNTLQGSSTSSITAPEPPSKPFLQKVLDKLTGKTPSQFSQQPHHLCR